MSNVAVVIDSTAYIPEELVKKHNITVIPQVLIWGEETLRDGIDILPQTFYTRLEKASAMPTTSQATIPSFKEAYTHLLENSCEVLTITLSSKLSGTMDSAIQARSMLPGAAIEIVDSQTTSMALGFLALEAARAAEQGASLKECRELVERLKPDTGVIFAVSTLEFLHRGGRIGGGTRFLATALNIKPILELQEGRVEGVERVRTRKKSLSRLIELVEERINGRKPVHLAVLHANSADEAREVLDEATGRLLAVESVFSQVSPVVGAHTGPGTVGLAFLAGE
jgi:DegV family protein with EDD domain